MSSAFLSGTDVKSDEDVSLQLQHRFCGRWGKPWTCLQLSAFRDNVSSLLAGEQIYTLFRRLVIRYGHWPVRAEHSVVTAAIVWLVLGFNGAYRSRFLPPTGLLLNAAPTDGERAQCVWHRSGEEISSIAAQCILRRTVTVTRPMYRATHYLPPAGTPEACSASGPRDVWVFRIKTFHNIT